jgi:hypothetical protein
MDYHFDPTSEQYIYIAALVHVHNTQIPPIMVHVNFRLLLTYHLGTVPDDE